MWDKPKERRTWKLGKQFRRLNKFGQQDILGKTARKDAAMGAVWEIQGAMLGHKGKPEGSVKHDYGFDLVN